MRQVFRSVALLLLTGFSVLFLTGVTSAQNAPETTNLLDGQKHYYTAMMRSDKRTLVYAKITFRNSSQTENLTSYTFKAPDGMRLSNLSIQQILALSGSANKPCTRFESREEVLRRIGGGNYSDNYYENAKRCLEYGEAPKYDEDFDFDDNMSSSTSYYDYYYYTRKDSKYEYSNLKPDQSGNRYTVTLAEPIKPNKQGAILISYITSDYTEGLLGRYNFDFKTFSVDQLVDRSVVAINFDDDIYSRLTSSKRQIAETFSGDSIARTSNGLGGGYSSPAIDDIQLGTGQGGRYIKEKAKLFPDEIFSVKGVFATNHMMLYINQIIGTIVAIGLIVAASILGYRLYRKKHPIIVKPPFKKTVKEKGKEVESVSGETAVHSESNFTNLNALAVAGITIGFNIFLIGGLLLMAVILPTDYNNPFMSVIVPLFTLVLLVIGSFVLPGVYMLRYGKIAMFKWLLVQTLLSVVLLIVLVCIVAVATVGTRSYPV